MRVKKLMGLAVVLVALAVAVNALAFKTANVTNTSTITIDTTSAAALAISGGTGSGFTSTIGTKGYLSIVVSEKMQPNSDYFFGPVFTITNKSASLVDITHAVSGTSNGVTVDLVKADGTSNIDQVDLALNGTIDVYLKITVPADFQTVQGGTLGASQSPTIKITATE